MENSYSKIPTQEETRLIFKDTYNFYLKYKNLTDPDKWVELMQDMREIDSRYPYDLCRQILLELVRVIEYEFSNKEGNR